MKTYLFNETGDFIGKREARRNPMYKPETHNPEDEWLINPRVETLEPPPSVSVNQKQVRDKGMWTIIDTIPEKPKGLSKYHAWDGKEWVISAEDQIKLNQDEQLLAEQIKQQEERALIEKEKQAVLEQQAITNLKQKGDLPQDYEPTSNRTAQSV